MSEYKFVNSFEFDDHNPNIKYNKNINSEKVFKEVDLQFDAPMWCDLLTVNSDKYYHERNIEEELWFSLPHPDHEPLIPIPRRSPLYKSPINNNSYNENSVLSSTSSYIYSPQSPLYYRNDTSTSSSSSSIGPKQLKFDAASINTTITPSPQLRKAYNKKQNNNNNNNNNNISPNNISLSADIEEMLVQHNHCRRSKSKSKLKTSHHHHHHQRHHQIKKLYNNNDNSNNNNNNMELSSDLEALLAQHNERVNSSHERSKDISNSHSQSDSGLSEDIENLLSEHNRKIRHSKHQTSHKHNRKQCNNSNNKENIQPVTNTVRTRIKSHRIKTTVKPNKQHYGTRKLTLKSSIQFKQQHNYLKNNINTNDDDHDITQKNDIMNLLQQHNKKIIQKNTKYVARVHSVRDIRKYEEFTGRKWYDLNPSERAEANEIISQLK